jgi:hypothetical protein
MTDNTNPDRTGDQGTPRQYGCPLADRLLKIEAGTLEDIITSLREAAERLAEMRAAGVALATPHSTEDAAATLVTDDPAVAERFGFEPAEYPRDVVDDAGGTMPVVVLAKTNGELRGWVYTRNMHHHGLPELEMRKVPLFLLPAAAALLYKLTAEMFKTGEPFRDGQTLERDQGRLRFVTSVPIPGEEDEYRHRRLQIADADPVSE